MNVFFLKDLQDDVVDAIIIASTSTKEDIKKAIEKTKEIEDGYQWEDLLNNLPSDCVVYDRWSSEKVYY